LIGAVNFYFHIKKTWEPAFVPGRRENKIYVFYCAYSLRPLYSISKAVVIGQIFPGGFEGLINPTSERIITISENAFFVLHFLF